MANGRGTSLHTHRLSAPSPAQGSLCRQTLSASRLQLREPTGPTLDTLQALAMTPRFWGLCRDGPASHS